MHGFAQDLPNVSTSGMLLVDKSELSKVLLEPEVHFSLLNFGNNLICIGKTLHFQIKVKLRLNSFYMRMTFSGKTFLAIGIIISAVYCFINKTFGK